MDTFIHILTVILIACIALHAVGSLREVLKFRARTSVPMIEAMAMFAVPRDYLRWIETGRIPECRIKPAPEQDDRLA